MILVTGATGQQGGAVTRALLAAGLPVRALVRNPESAAAQRLARDGALVAIGDYTDFKTIQAAIEGTTGVFSVQPFLRGRSEVEAGWGMELADRALNAGVRHFVYSSALGADQAPEVPHFASKARIEEHIHEIDLPATILRPANFMENLLRPPILKSILKRSKLITPASIDVRQPMIAVDDIGVIAAKAFQSPDQFIGQRIDLVSDTKSIREQAAVLSSVLGRPIKPGQLPRLITRVFLGSELCRMFRWIDTKMPSIKYDGEQVHAMYPDALDFESWARKAFFPSRD